MSYNRKLPYNDVLVIESMDDSTNGSTSGLTMDYFTYITIGFLYAFFLSILADRILNYESVERICGEHVGPDVDPGTMGKRIVNYNSPENVARRNACRKARSAFDSRKFSLMIALGIFSVIGGGLLVRSDAKYTTGGLGVALGGFLSVVYFTFYNWETIDKDIRILILGASVATLFYGSTQMY